MTEEYELTAGNNDILFGSGKDGILEVSDDVTIPDGKLLHYIKVVVNEGATLTIQGTPRLLCAQSHLINYGTIQFDGLGKTGNVWDCSQPIRIMQHISVKTIYNSCVQAAAGGPIAVVYAPYVINKGAISILGNTGGLLGVVANLYEDFNYIVEPGHEPETEVVGTLNPGTNGLAVVTAPGR